MKLETYISQVAMLVNHGLMMLEVTSYSRYIHVRLQCSRPIGIKRFCRAAFVSFLFL